MKYQIKLTIIALVIGLFLTFNQTTNAQSALDGFDPNANGTVRAVVVQPDGKIIIGGDFTTVLGAARNRIARLNPDGTLDTTFDPNVSNIVFSIAVQPDGKILLGGLFTSLAANGGAAVTRNNIARVNADGTLDTTFNPNANDIVYSVAVQSDGRILLGGAFTTLSPNGGAAVTRNRIARLNTDGTLDTAFNPNAGSAVRSIVVQTDGRILLGGNFSTLAPNGGASMPRNSIARVNTDGTLDTIFNPSANSTVFSIAVQSDGRILLGGNFNSLAPNGGAAMSRNYIARVNADGTLDTAFSPNANDVIYSIAVQPDGKILLGGGFTTLAPNGGAAVSRNRIARVNADGTLDTAFNPNANGVIYSIAVQPDGKILLGGGFTTLAPNGGAAVTRNYIARLKRDGTADRTLDINTVGNLVYATAIQPDGKIIIGGSFSSVLGMPRNNIARLNPDGTLDTAFNPNANGTIFAIAVQSDGRILIGGNFNGANSINGTTTRNFIARLETTGLVDTVFDPNANSVVYAIAVQSDGRILIGGNFNGANSINGTTTRNRIARLETTGLVDTAFDPNANSGVFAIAVQSDGKILVGGQFTTIGGQTRNRFARLSNDTAALSSLYVLKTSVTLTRNGSAAQFTRVIFEQSVDNGATYTTLGTATNSLTAPPAPSADSMIAESANVSGKSAGTKLFAAARSVPTAQIVAAPTASGYTLTGLNLPTGQNILIRARGFYRTGYFGGSETIEDKVQNVYLLGTTAAGVTIAGRLKTADGRGLMGATVMLTTADGRTVTARSTAFGAFHFDGLAAGQAVIVTVQAKRYVFAPQLISLTDNLSNLELIAVN